MSNYDSYQYRSGDVDEPRRHRSQRASRPVREREYRETRVEQATPRSTRQMELVRRTVDDDDVEEVQREFPPGGGDPRRLARRPRSLDRNHGGYAYQEAAYARYNGDPRRSGGAAAEVQATRSRRHDDDRRSRRRSLSRGQEIAAAAGGAGIAVGAKELWDRRDGGKHRSRSRSRVGTAALGVAGAVAGDVAARQYSKHHHHRDRDDDHRSTAVRARASRSDARGPDGAYYSEDDYEAREKPKKSRRKSLGEAAIGALGLREVLNGGSDDRHRRDRDRDYRSDRSDRSGRSRGRGHRKSRRGSSSSDSRSRSRSRDGKDKLQQAAKAALTAAAAEAWRSRKEPGGFFDGQKARRILTAAAGAGGIDALVDRDPDKHSGRHVGEGAIGGLLLNRIVNGPRSESTDRKGRARSRSVGGGLKDLAGAAVAAGIGKKVFDKVKERSRSRGRGKKYSDSDSSVSPAPRKRRSNSVSALIDRGMAKIGISEANEARIAREQGTRGGGDGGRSRGAPGGAVVAGSARGGRGRRGSSSSSDTDSDFSLSEEEKSRRKLRGKEVLTGALATVATVHAAHEIYESMEKRDKRRKKVLEGTMSPEEAKRLKRTATVKDAFAVGIAALGIKGAYAGWQEMREQQHEFKELETKLQRHRRLAAQRAARGDQGRANRRYSDPNLASSAQGGGHHRGQQGPVYNDGNPYASGGAPNY